MIRKFAVVLLVCWCSSAMASAKKFFIEGQHFVFDIPKTWQAAPNLFGVPLILLGPEKYGRRPVISVVPTQLKNLKFDSEGLNKDAGGYRDGRENWLKKVGGKSIEYFPYARERWSKYSESQTIGYRYKIGENEFIEYSYFVSCGQSFFQLKTVLSAASNSRFGKSTKKIIESLACK
jgi:hypothetical protein